MATKEYRMSSQRKTLPLAIVSLVSGIFGCLILPILGSVVAIVTGHLARARIARDGSDGSGLAGAGLSLGWLSLAFWLLSALLLVGFGVDTASLPTSSISRWEGLASARMRAPRPQYVPSTRRSRIIFGQRCHAATPSAPRRIREHRPPDQYVGHLVSLGRRHPRVVHRAGDRQPHRDHHRHMARGEIRRQPERWKATAWRSPGLVLGWVSIG